MKIVFVKIQKHAKKKAKIAKKCLHFAKKPIIIHNVNRRYPQGYERKEHPPRRLRWQKGTTMKGYKAMNKNWTCMGYKYESGKTYELADGKELEMCRRGFHFCKNPVDVYGFYPHCSETIIVEIEALGRIEQMGTKYCTDKIYIGQEVGSDQIVWNPDNNGSYNTGHNNSGNHNSGDHNTGSCNAGNHNTGSFSFGSFNTGSNNAGNHNSGDCNSGSYNAGSYNAENGNSGSFNAGSFNSGNHNSGDCNSGSYNVGSHNVGGNNSGGYNVGSHNVGSFNSGSFNSGSYNSGSHNSGSHNVGSFNSGSHNVGFFNTSEPTVRLFNTDSGMTFEEVRRLRIDWGNLEVSRDIIESIPNYDAEIFYKCTGIDWRSNE